ncbi:HupE/UreJ family protein [Paenibacillus sepulcri]|uniref:HupE/UreJ family protein n=2 Tax=Paenibacillus sepulcri TaxID=359917 RepID=A0ABS7BWT1_9BACL|nr:HupE/UreJ family protein [Paenibacillus sepulcri]
MFGIWVPVSAAHGNISVAYSDISMEKGIIKYVFQLDMYDMIAEVNLDDPDINLSTQEVLNRFYSKYHAEVATDLLSKIELYADNLPLKGKLTQFRFIEKEGEAQPFAEVVLEYPVRNVPRQLALNYNVVFERDQWHVNYVNLHVDELQKTAVFITQLHELQVGQMSLQYALKQFFLIGLEYWLTAVEAILFLLALLIGCRSVKQYLMVAVIFAVALCLTLILAGLHILVLPDRFVESLIALSILYIALNSLFNKNMKYQIGLAGGFGLIHGFGFAEAVSGMRVDGGHSVSSLAAYNVGIETGLLLLALILYPIIHYLHKIKRGIPALLTAIALFGLVWFIIKAYL